MGSSLHWNKQQGINKQQHLPSPPVLLPDFLTDASFLPPLTNIPFPGLIANLGGLGGVLFVMLLVMLLVPLLGLPNSICMCDILSYGKTKNEKYGEMKSESGGMK
jgi:hypothetical protein